MYFIVCIALCLLLWYVTSYLVVLYLFLTVQFLNYLSFFKFSASLAANSQSSKINPINSDKDIEIDNESSAVVIEPVNDDGEIVIVGEGAGDSDAVGENIPKPDLPNVFDSVSAPLAQATVPGNGTAVADVVSVALATDQQGTAASKPTSQVCNRIIKTYSCYDNLLT